MDHISIPIPEGMDPKQKEALTQWLTKQAAECSSERLPFEDDPEWRAEVAAQLDASRADIEAGRVMDSTEARRRLNEKLRRATDA